MANNKQISEWRNNIENINDQCETLVKSASPREFILKPAPNRWSLGQCLDHLNKVSTKLIPALEKSLQNPGKNSDKIWVPGKIEKIFLRVVGPKPGMPVPVPPPYVPALVPEQEETLDTFLKNHLQLIEILDKAISTDVSRIRISSPAMPLLRVSFACWIESNIIHDNYHLTQAGAVLAEIQQQS